MGRYVEASTALRRSVEIRERLALDNPAVTLFLPELAAAQGDLALTLWFTHDYSAAAEAHRRAIASHSKLLTAHPKDLGILENIVVNQTNLGNALWPSRELSGAVEAYRQAIAMGRRLVDAAPSHPGYRHTLGRALNNLGAILQDEWKRYEDAVFPLREAVDLQRLAFEQDHGTSDRLRHLNESYVRLAKSLRVLHRGGRPRG